MTELISIRPETLDDVREIRRVNELALGGKNEAFLVDALRAAADPHISLVAVAVDQIVGHIFSSPVSVEGEDSCAMGLAPMAVLPDFQRKGIGSKLVREGLKKCQQLSHNVIVVLGHPDYHPGFGFVLASRHGLHSEYQIQTTRLW